MSVLNALNNRALHLLVVVATVGYQTNPSKDSFREYQLGLYVNEVNANTTTAYQPFVRRDQSYNELPAQSGVKDHHFFSFGWTRQFQTKSTVDGKKIYQTHLYLGLWGWWWSLPYLPMPKKVKRPSEYFLGLCVRSYCACVPNIGGRLIRYTWGVDAMLNMIVMCNLLLWIFVNYDSNSDFMEAHMTASLANFRLGRWWTVVVSAFTQEPMYSYYGIISFVKNIYLVLETLDVIIWEAGSHYFLLLYIGAGLFHLLGTAALMKIRGEDPTDIMYASYRGSRAAIVALLAFLSQTKGGRDWQIEMSWLMVRIPVPMGPLTYIIASCALDAISYGLEEIAGTLASYAFGRYVFHVYNTYKNSKLS